MDTLSPCVHGCRTVLAPTGTEKFQFGGKTSADTSLTNVMESHPPKEHHSSKAQEIPAPCAWRKLSDFTKPTKMSSSQDKTTSKPGAVAAEVLAAERHFSFHSGPFSQARFIQVWIKMDACFYGKNKSSNPNQIAKCPLRSSCHPV